MSFELFDPEHHICDPGLLDMIYLTLNMIYYFDPGHTYWMCSI